MIKKTLGTLKRMYRQSGYAGLRTKYAKHTMVPKETFISNLELCYVNRNVLGSVVECGVWKGGMSAAIAELYGSSRSYYLFDSFEGLPEVQEIDGPAAKEWQANTESATYYDNCKAQLEDAEKAMAMAGVSKVQVIKGWFNETLPNVKIENGIAVLRLDGDWYESTMECLVQLFDQVNKGGIIIIDDYYSWDGCSRAVHDFLSNSKRPERIMQMNGKVCYIKKK